MKKEHEASVKKLNDKITELNSKVETDQTVIKAGNENLESSRKEYTMLNNSMYRLKKEKEENEQQQADYIQTLEKRDKERV